MLLAIDVGNTNTVLGLYDGAALRADWRLDTEHRRMADEWAALLIALLGSRGFTLRDVHAAIASVVVPPVTTALREMAERHLGYPLMIVSPDIDTGARALVDNPREVGADRIVNSHAAYRRYGGPCLVVDFGTATNFDVVNPDGNYIGGSLAPGLGISADALFRYASRLYRVELVAPPHAIGKNTMDCLQSGIVLGYVGLVEGLVTRIKAELLAEYGWDAVQVVATGGLAPLIARETRCIDHLDPDLTLDGLRMIYELNTVARTA
jgi:type III pantothenate kinase